MDNVETVLSQPKLQYTQRLTVHKAAIKSGKATPSTIRSRLMRVQAQEAVARDKREGYLCLSFDPTPHRVVLLALKGSCTH